MASQALLPENDPIRPGGSTPIGITVDGKPATGLTGQTIAAIMMAEGRLSWRRSSVAGEPRGLFCGIGICFDCLVVVNGERDVRACQRRAVSGDAIEFQHDELPGVAG
ncbi:MAG: (2Fe-2S)-binding protein [Candidatus Saccharibacteria bacterium]|nr:(2Fe-2S)-binding protein [Microbacteriaceae bacterium]